VHQLLLVEADQVLQRLQAVVVLLLLLAEGLQPQQDEEVQVLEEAVQVLAEAVQRDQKKLNLLNHQLSQMPSLKLSSGNV